MEALRLGGALSFRAAAASRRGDSHAENQDAWCMRRGRRPGPGQSRSALYAVADGVSSTRRGQWAAQVTCRRLCSAMDGAGPGEVDDLVQTIAEVDWELRENGRGDAACTLTAAWLRGDELALLHVGDSHLFRVRDGRVERLSRDGGAGARLSTFMGMGANVSDALQVVRLPLLPGDGLLLCTDGVTSVIRHTELAGWWLATGRDPERCVKGVVAEVGRRQGDDDATLVAVAIDG